MLARMVDPVWPATDTEPWCNWFWPHCPHQTGAAKAFVAMRRARNVQGRNPGMETSFRERSSVHPHLWRAGGYHREKGRTTRNRGACRAFDRVLSIRLRCWRTRDGSRVRLAGESPAPKASESVDRSAE